MNTPTERNTMTHSSSLVQDPELWNPDNNGMRTPPEEVAFLRAYYGSLFERLLLILHRADLIGIAEFGGSAHDLEVMKLLQTLPKLHSAQEVGVFLQYTLEDSWLPYGFPITKPEQLPVVAQDIWQAWKTYRRSPSRAGKLLIAHYEPVTTFM